MIPRTFVLISHVTEFFEQKKLAIINTGLINNSDETDSEARNVRMVDT